MIEFVRFDNYSPLLEKHFLFQDCIFEQIVMALELNTTETLEKIDHLGRFAKSNGCVNIDTCSFNNKLH